MGYGESSLNYSAAQKLFASTGPTCDSTDVVCQDIEMELLGIGDVIYFSNMGAYTIPLRTPFNGFEETNILHFIDFKDWYVFMDSD